MNLFVEAWDSIQRLRECSSVDQICSHSLKMSYTFILMGVGVSATTLLIVFRRSRIFTLNFMLCFYFVVLLFVMSGCASRPLQSLCIVEPAHHTCWEDKSKNEGTPIEEMHGWYCVNRSDMERVTRALNQCSNSPDK